MRFTAEQWALAYSLWLDGVKGKGIETQTGIPKAHIYAKACRSGWPKRQATPRLTETLLASMRAAWDSGASYSLLKRLHPISQNQWGRRAKKEGWRQWPKGRRNPEGR